MMINSIDDPQEGHNSIEDFSCNHNHKVKNASDYTDRDDGGDDYEERNLQRSSQIKIQKNPYLIDNFCHESMIFLVKFCVNK